MPKKFRYFIVRIARTSYTKLYNEWVYNAQNKREIPVKMSVFENWMDRELIESIVIAHVRDRMQLPSVETENNIRLEYYYSMEEVSHKEYRDLQITNNILGY